MNIMTTERAAVIKERVARGAARLDEQEPDWRSKVAVSRLDIDDPFQCILGQVYGNYIAGINGLGIRYGDDSVAHGFLMCSDETFDLYPESPFGGHQEELEILIEAWVEEIDRVKEQAA